MENKSWIPFYYILLHPNQKAKIQHPEQGEKHPQGVTERSEEVKELADSQGQKQARIIEIQENLVMNSPNGPGRHPTTIQWQSNPNP